MSGVDYHMQVPTEEEIIMASSIEIWHRIVEAQALSEAATQERELQTALTARIAATLATQDGHTYVSYEVATAYLPQAKTVVETFIDFFRTGN